MKQQHPPYLYVCSYRHERLNSLKEYGTQKFAFELLTHVLMGRDKGNRKEAEKNLRFFFFQPKILLYGD